MGSGTGLGLLGTDAWGAEGCRCVSACSSDVHHVSLEDSH